MSSTKSVGVQKTIFFTSDLSITELFAIKS